MTHNDEHRTVLRCFAPVMVSFLQRHARGLGTPLHVVCRHTALAPAAGQNQIVILFTRFFGFSGHVITLSFF